MTNPQEGASLKHETLCSIAREARQEALDSCDATI
jgi:hypothetical protein